MIKTGPLGTFLMNLLKPSSGSPSVSLRASSLIFNKYSALVTAVLISFAVYAIGLPICSVRSFANTSFRAESSCNAFFTMACRCFSEVRLKSLKAFVATTGNSAASSSDRPCRLRICSFVMGEMVLRCSDAMALKMVVERRKKSRQGKESDFRFL